MIALAFGGNLSNSRDCIASAMDELSKMLHGSRQSTIWLTKPLGPGSSDYCNSVIVGDYSSLTSYGLWRLCQAQEVKYGRERAKEEVWGDRVLDIDLLFYHDTVCATEDLLLPHPQMHRRSFVMGPLKELCPDWQHFLFTL